MITYVSPLLTCIVALFISQSCVSKKKFTAAVEDYTYCTEQLSNLQKEYNALSDEKTTLLETTQKQTEEWNTLKNAHEKLKSDYNFLLSEKIELDSLFESMANQNQSLISKKAQELNALSQQLAVREQRLERLTQLLADKENQMNTMKETLENALVQYQGKGLEIQQRDGKLYIVLENSLLFASGSWKLNQSAKAAIETLAQVLSNEGNLDLIIEGHTDNVRYSSKGSIEDNWDLSVKRSTSVVKHLLSKQPSLAGNIMAAGKGEFAPIADNSTTEGRDKNRRIEIIVLPDLGEFEKLLHSSPKP